MKSVSLTIAVLGVCLSAIARADAPMPVTSDTPGYCLNLAQRMEQGGVMRPDMRVLWESGREMCQHGHVRGGLARLRRAMMIRRGDLP